MKSKIRFAAFFTGIWIAGFILIQGQETEAFSSIMGDVIANFEKIQTVQSDISFEIHVNERYFYLKGKYYSAPDQKYRMEFSPYGSEIKIISNGKRVWFYVENIKTVYVSDLKQDYSQANKNIYATPTMAGRDLFSRDFNIRFLEKQRKGWGDLHVYEAVPKISQEFVSRILFWVDPNLGVIRKAESYDLHGNVASLISFDKYRAFEKEIWFPLRIDSMIREAGDVLKNDVKFNNVMINKVIDDQIFEFEIPENTKVEYVDASTLKGDELIKK